MATKTTKQSKNTKKKNKNKLPLIILLLLLAIGLVVVGIYVKSEFNDIVEVKNEIQKGDIINENDDIDTSFLKAIVPEEIDSNDVHIINVSEISSLPEFQYDTLINKRVRHVYSGRRINIAVTGIDARLGTRTKHADANHIISILLDSGQIEIISIPRDTPADAGFDDSTGQNKLTIVRAAKGQKSYFSELSRIANLDKIHNFAELGFSQAMGIIEFLGFRNPNETLQVLRSRTALGGDDYQRVYNQAQFIKQMLFKNFHRLKGPFSDIIIGGGLMLVESDLTISKINDIIRELDEKGFGNSIDNIKVKIRPTIGINFKIYDFSNKETVNSLSNRVRTYFQNKHSSTDSADSPKSTNDISRMVYNKLNSALDKSALDTAKNPRRVISNLSVYFDQRAWLQIQNKEQRREIRDRFINLLSYSYEKRKDTTKANNIREIAIKEDNLFNSTNNIGE